MFCSQGCYFVRLLCCERKAIELERLGIKCLSRSGN
jgi:hypothetical protein